LHLNHAAANIEIGIGLPRVENYHQALGCRVGLTRASD
jgi:hypothetical protein